MSLRIMLAIAATAAGCGILVGYFLRLIIALVKKQSIEFDVKRIISQAEEKAKEIVATAEKQSIETLREVRIEAKEKEEGLKKNEERLIKKEELLDKRQGDLELEVEGIKQKINEIKAIKDTVEALEEKKKKEIERIAQMSQNEAKESLISIIEKNADEDLAIRMRKLETQGEEKLEKRAQDILATAVQRLAGSFPADVMSTTIQIPSDDIKGKIIGKEGRNIKTFERVTGVELIVDDTPGAITISSFNPIRRHVARVALENLIADGRIQPAKIEEIVEKAKNEINKIIKEKGEQAAYECGLFNIDPRVILILGRLYFRTSYGQNVLQHSVEMAHIAGMIAEELGANVSVTKAAALVHDIGKALDHEVVGTHVEIGRRILQKFGVNEEIIKAMQAHHGEYPFETVEAVIVQVADAVSGSRPGARRDSVENYLKRLEELEAIATSFKGVEKAYALQAGREIRIFVTPTEISDIEAKSMARNIVMQIENDLKYPGEIKVTVIRESRVIEFAR